MQKGVFVYPWDVAIMGTATVLDQLTATGVNTVLLTTSYHHTRFLRPHTRSFGTRPQSGITFQPNLALYDEIKPEVHQDIADACILEKTKEACAARGVDFQAWHINLHSSSLGVQYPQHCAQNAWGDPYYFSLCPSNPAVRQYAKSLLQDMLARVGPSRVSMESAAFLPCNHGEHHEVANVDVGDSGRWLLSLCFCPSCLQRAQNAGVDGRAALHTARRLLERICQKDVGWETEEKATIACYLLECPELYAYEKFRQSTVASLAQELHDITAALGVGLDFIPGSLVFPTNQSFLEGCSYTALASTVDRFLLLAYGQTPAAVRHAVRTVGNLAPQTPLAVALNMRYGTVSSQSELLARIQVLKEEGVAAVNFYNYGVFNEERFAWLQAACAAL